MIGHEIIQSPGEKRWYRFCVLYYFILTLLFVQIMVLILSTAGWLKPENETIGMWLQRAGSIVVGLSFLQTLVEEKARRYINPTTRWGIRGDLYAQNKYSESFVGFTFRKILVWTDAIMTIIGTVAWGYGDLLYDLLIGHS